MDFIRQAVTVHKASDGYKEAAAGEEYYAKRNATITAFKKLIRTLRGKLVEDVFASNHKIKTLFFRRFVIQQVQYVLSNGVTFEKPETKEKLGSGFDYDIQKAAKKAMVDGVAFCFWNNDHLEIFGLADTRKEPGFAPLYDEEFGLLRAGIRYWQCADGKTDRYTLYEVDGYTEYIKRKDADMEVLTEKQDYVKTVNVDWTGGVEIVDSGNYPGFPIIPFYANDLHESELNGIREAIDCYDLIKSGLANDIDDTSGFYWVLKNSGGMDDMDLTRFVERMKTVRAAAVDADQGVSAEAHTMDIPTNAREVLLNRLRNDLYEDFQLVDLEKCMSGDMTATAIRMAYQPQDDKCGDFEYCIREFIQALFTLIGIEDEPSFKWNRIANQLEETNMVLSAANYLDDEAVLKHLPWLTPEEVDEILKRRDADDILRLTTQEPTGVIVDDA